MNLQEAISYDALYASMCNCQKGVLWKDSVAHFVLNAPEELMKLETELETGSYKPRKPKSFVIESPKHREISSIPFRDRVYQRSLNDNIIYPAMTKSFIFDNWACQKGKGTDAARARMTEFLRKFYRKHGTDGFFSQFDIHGYYPNMDHNRVEEMFGRRLDKETHRRTLAILRHQYPDDKGYNPGSQIIQIAGISILDDLDHYIKEQLHMRFYLRYMDDFIMIHHDYDYLKECQTKVVQKLREYGFEINEKKTRIFPISDGIMFLGFQYRITDSGKVLLLINPKNVKAKRKNLRRLVARSKKGLIPKASVDESYRAWRDHASKGNSYHLLQRMDKYYQDLWREQQDVENSKTTVAP